MANPTTNYGFVLPTPTDLVTDLPADFDVALQGVDTQMLTNANAAIAKTIVDAQGDIIAATGADAVSRLAVGANDTVLTADSTTATGLKWAAAASSTGPAFQAYRSSNYTISFGAATKVQLNAENFDTDACYDSTTNYRFTPTTAGKYVVTLGAYFNTSALNSATWWVYKNGSQAAQLGGLTGVAYDQRMSGSTIINMNGTTDYIELYYLASAVNTTVYGGTALGIQFSASFLRS